MFDNNYLYPLDTGLSHSSHQSHSSHIFARAARTPISPTIARVAQTSPAGASLPLVPNSKFRIFFAAYTILTIYKRYRKSEQKAKNRRSINI